MRPIHVGIPISYDYKYLPLCLKQIYDHADKITLAIDINRMTWAGKSYEIDESFLSEILANDPFHKISLYEDDFCKPELSTMGCDKRERRMIKQYMKSDEEDAWHLQLDTDEYFIDFQSFVKYLHKIEAIYKGDVSVCVKWKTIFKITSQGIIIANDNEGLGYFPVASIGGSRWNPSPSEIRICADFSVLHQSWGRSEDEVQFKIANWSHNGDFNVENYFFFWKSVNKYNAPYIHNCHPLGEKAGWNWLQYIDGDMNNVITRLKECEPDIAFRPSVIRHAKNRKLMESIRSNKLVQKIKSLVKGVISKR